MRALIFLVLTPGALVGFSTSFRSFDAANPTTAALGLLVIVLGTATLSPLWVTVINSFAATLCLNFFFVPPVGTFFVADGHNGISLAAFVFVGVVASRLSSAAQSRAREAVARRNELGLLFDLSRDVLLTDEGESSLEPLARHVARRFGLSHAAFLLPSKAGGWVGHQGAPSVVEIPPDQLDRVMALAGNTLEFDAKDRAYGGQSIVDAGGVDLRLVPLRLGVRVIGLFAAPASLDAGSADAIAGLVAIAIERHQLLRERKEAALVRQKADLATALLASMSHDLRTPLTTIGVAVDNLDNAAIPPEQRRMQVQLAQSELRRLNRLFREILDMARIDAGVLPIQREWVTAADIVDAACVNLRPDLGGRDLSIDADDSTAVFVDPRLTTAALSQLIENAAQYSLEHRPIELCGWVDTEGLHLSVRDHGPGLDPSEIDHLFDRFYRGRQAGLATGGSGMGLAITRGLLKAESGRVSGENLAGGGAMFSIVVPAESRAVDTEV